MCQVKQIVKQNGRVVEVCNEWCRHTPGQKGCTGEIVQGYVTDIRTRRPGESYKEFKERGGRK